MVAVMILLLLLETLPLLTTNNRAHLKLQGSPQRLVDSLHPPSSVDVAELRLIFLQPLPNR